MEGSGGEWREQGRGREGGKDEEWRERERGREGGERDEGILFP